MKYFIIVTKFKIHVFGVLFIEEKSSLDTFSFHKIIIFSVFKYRRRSKWVHTATIQVLFKYALLIMSRSLNRIRLFSLSHTLALCNCYVWVCVRTTSGTAQHFSDQYIFARERPNVSFMCVRACPLACCVTRVVRMSRAACGVRFYSVTLCARIRFGVKDKTFPLSSTSTVWPLRMCVCVSDSTHAPHIYVCVSTP